MPVIQTSAAAISFIEQGCGESVTLLHGIQGTARTWDAVAPMLAERHRVVMPDLRGRGNSCIPADPEAYSLAAFAGDLSTVLDMVGEPTLLVAWSMGVSVTLELLRQAPRKPLRGLVLISGTPCAGKEARWFTANTLSGIAAEAQARAKRLGLTQAADPHAVAASWLHVQKADYRSLLRDIAIPTLIVHGVDDDQCPIEHGRLIAASIPGARMEEWDDTGHNPMAKDAARIARAILAFNDTLHRTAGTSPAAS